MTALIAPTVNFVFLVVLLVVYCRKPLREFVAARHRTTRDELHRVAEQLRKAQEQYDEFSAKLAAMQAEITQLREQSRQDAEAMKLKITLEGKRVAESVRAGARVSAATMLDDLRSQITRELSARVLSRAEAIVAEQLKDSDRERLRKDFARELEAAQ